MHKNSKVNIHTLIINCSPRGTPYARKGLSNKKVAGISVKFVFQLHAGNGCDAGTHN